VQILSSNLVSNGDFSQEGSQLITNGDFATDSGWNKQTSNWTIVNGYAVCDGLQTSNSSLFQDVAVVNGKSYRIDFTITDSVNNLNLILGATTIGQYGSGTHSIYVTKDASTARIFFQATASNNFSGSIDNVSVKEVGQGWNLGSGWSVVASVANASGSVNANISQNSFLTIGSKYKVTYTVLNASTGARVGLAPNASTIQNIRTENGTYIEIYEAVNTSLYIRSLWNNGVGLSITNISVIEISSDTNLPRIDYTGGEGHWLFEPQSTNLITTSEPTSTPSSKTGVVFQRTDVFDWNGIYYGDNSVMRVAFFNSATTVGVDVTFSVFVKMTNGNAPNVGTSSSDDFKMYISSAITTGLTIVNIGGGIYKCSVTKSASSTSSLVGIQKVVGNSANTFEVSGFQVEQNSYATSYIPTNGSTVTRLQDAAFGAGSSDLINSTEGVLYFDGLFLSDGFKFVSLNSGSATNRVSIYSSSQSTIGYNVRNSNGNQMNGNFVIDSTINHKCALKFKENDFALWIDGVEVVTDNSGTTFSSGTLNELSYNGGAVGSSNFFGKTKCLAVFKEALTDEELECLTTI
jgi:hypothetical protein